MNERAKRMMMIEETLQKHLKEMDNAHNEISDLKKKLSECQADKQMFASRCFSLEKLLAKHDKNYR